MIKELLHSDGTITTVPARKDGNGAAEPTTEKVAACTRIAPDDISRIVEKPRDGDLLWLDIEEPTEEDLTLLQREFGFHLLAIEDIRHQNQRPKVDDYGAFVHIII